MRVRKWIIECANKSKSMREFYKKVREHIIKQTEKRQRNYPDWCIKAIDRECFIVAKCWEFEIGGII